MVRRGVWRKEETFYKINYVLVVVYVKMRKGQIYYMDGCYLYSEILHAWIILNYVRN